MPPSLTAESIADAAAHVKMCLSGHSKRSSTVIDKINKNEKATQIFSSSSRKKEQLYSLFKNWVYICTSAIAERAAGQDVYVGKIIGENADQSSRSILSKLYGRSGSKLRNRHFKAPIQEILPVMSHRVLDLLAKPNPAQYRPAFVQSIALSLLITGETYIFYDKTEDGQEYIWPLPSSWIEPDKSKNIGESYLLRTSALSQPVAIDGSNVARIYNPDPKNPLEAISALETQFSAVNIDEKILRSQDASFDNGIFPHLVIRAGGMPDEDGIVRKGQSLPVLTQAQRKQIVGAIRKLWGGVQHSGDPIILDGLIEDVFKVSRTPNEMDWQNSVGQVKGRIFQAYKVNPIVVGEITGANRAQAIIADRQFCDNVVNPLLSQLSLVFTYFLLPKFSSDRMILWFDPSTPSDDDARNKAWDTARRNRDVTKNEYRCEILDLPPDDLPELSPVISNPGVITVLGDLFAKVEAGFLSPESCSIVLQEVLFMDEDKANKIVNGIKVSEKPTNQIQEEPETNEVLV